ncbi:MAG: ABC transporter ATP-binding protein [Bacillota bacterium]|nr:ABC transporter ATP-binding protein [Bacillota bacterium]
MTTALEIKDVYLTYRSVKSSSIKRYFGGGKKDREDKVVHAINGVDLSVEKGDILGIVGQNGSGKSTLLRMIAGVFVPDRGTIDLKGNSCSLLAVGIGFIPKLTGRDNIILSGMLLGFSRDEISARLDDIIEYSELGSFIDSPVRTYSSGMYSKLAFSITAMLRTDILLIDEVLSVGDERFKKKSYDTMKELIKDGDRTVVIVSHSLEQLRENCTKVAWLDGGVIRAIGDPSTVIEEYRKDQMK